MHLDPVDKIALYFIIALICLGAYLINQRIESNRRWVIQYCIDHDQPLEECPKYQEFLAHD